MDPTDVSWVDEDQDEVPQVKTINSRQQPKGRLQDLDSSELDGTMVCSGAINGEVIEFGLSGYRFPQISRADKCLKQAMVCAGEPVTKCWYLSLCWRISDNGSCKSEIQDGGPSFPQRIFDVEFAEGGSTNDWKQGCQTGT
jgi:hypothetical protein